MKLECVSVIVDAACGVSCYVGSVLARAALSLSRYVIWCMWCVHTPSQNQLKSYTIEREKGATGGEERERDLTG